MALLHGSGSNRESVLDHLAVLAGAGYGVLAFDARGHGDSAGSGMDLGWHGEDDLGGALDHVATSRASTRGRLGAVGLSMGGEEALALLGDPLLDAVVAEGATGRGRASTTGGSRSTSAESSRGGWTAGRTGWCSVLTGRRTAAVAAVRVARGRAGAPGGRW